MKHSQAVEKVSESKVLNPQQIAFVEAVTSHPWPSIADAAVMAGYERNYAYNLHRIPAVKAAIESRCKLIAEENEACRVRLIAKFGELALKGDGREAREDGKLFFQGLNVGQGGVKVVTHVTQNAGQADALEDRLRRLNEAEIVSQDS